MADMNFMALLQQLMEVMQQQQGGTPQAQGQQGRERSVAQGQGQPRGRWQGQGQTQRRAATSPQETMAMLQNFLNTYTPGGQRQTTQPGFVGQGPEATPGQPATGGFGTYSPPPATLDEATAKAGAASPPAYTPGAYEGPGATPGQPSTGGFGTWNQPAATVATPAYVPGAYESIGGGGGWPASGGFGESSPDAPWMKQ